jgi:outer membrane autotransporter protein
MESGSLYADASARVGRVKTDFSSRDFDGANGARTKYDSTSNYYGAHAGLGYLLKLDGQSTLDLSARYLWTRQASDSVRLSSGDPLKFARADSSRTRLGARFAWAATERITPYVGAYYDHEFDGKAKGSTTDGLRIDSPSLKGDTGIAEIGFSMQPAKGSPLSLEAGIQGFTGKREGVMGGVVARNTFF